MTLEGTLKKLNNQWLAVINEINNDHIKYEYIEIYPPDKNKLKKTDENDIIEFETFMFCLKHKKSNKICKCTLNNTDGKYLIRYAKIVKIKPNKLKL